MKTMILSALALVCLQSNASGKVASYPWKSLTCDQLIQAVQANDMVKYGSRKLFNKGASSSQERTEFCQQMDFRSTARSAPPIATLDKSNFFNLCPIGRVAFKCVDQIEH